MGNTFLEKARSIYGEKYDYSKVEYVNSKTKVLLICKLHGKFYKPPDKFINRNQGCPRCSIEAQAKKYRTDGIKILAQFRKVHGNKYGYSLVDYKNAKTKVKIICSTHGIFEQIPTNHLRHGCCKCGKEGQVKLEPKLKVMAKRVRAGIHSAMSKGGVFKKSRTKEILGGSWVEFKSHLENNPYEFKLSDTEIDLDHIVPISSANTEEDILKLNYYTNFQLLPAYYNRWIKVDKQFNREQFEVWYKNKYK